MLRAIAQTLLGMGLITFVISIFLIFTALFGPFTLFHALGILAFFGSSFVLGKAVLGDGRRYQDSVD